MKHTGTIPFETPRLFCRPFQPEDAGDMLEHWISDPRVQEEYGEPAYETSEAVAGILQTYLDSYCREETYRWAIIEKKSGRNIGQIAFCRVYPDCRTAEIEYCIGRAFWGNGYAGEALEGVLSFSFTHTDFDKLEAFHREENVRSGRVLEKSVMHITDNVLRFVLMGEPPIGEVCYCITADQWRDRSPV